MESTRSIKKNVLWKERNLPICAFRRKKAIDVFYTYYENKPSSHRLEFRKRKRTVFEIFLPQHGEDLSRICAVIDEQTGKEISAEAVFNFWQCMFFRIFAGKITWSRDLFMGPSSSLDSPFGQTSSEYLYRLAYLRNGKSESVIIVSSRQGNTSGIYRNDQKTEFNWFKLSLSEFKDLIGNLHSFLMSKAFAEIQEKLL